MTEILTILLLAGALGMQAGIIALLAAVVWLLARVRPSAPRKDLPAAGENDTESEKAARRDRQFTEGLDSILNFCVRPPRGGDSG